MQHATAAASGYALDGEAALLQLGGDGNDEALQSGAWWFYYKLGFRPEDPEVRRLLRSELRLMRDDPCHRSSTATLQRLSSEPLFLYPNGPKRDVLVKIPLGELGLRVSRLLADRFGAEFATGEVKATVLKERPFGLTLAGFVVQTAGLALRWARVSRPSSASTSSVSSATWAIASRCSIPSARR